MAEDLKFEDEMQALLSQKPFEPFAVIAASGDRFEVLDPDKIINSRDVFLLVQETSGMVILRKNQMVGLQRR
jgi:hypothetical protein